MSTRHIRRFGASTLVMIALLAFAACGGNTQPTPTATAPAQPQPTATASNGSASSTPSATSTSSFDAASYFKGKTIRMLVGYKPGGGTDTQARYLAAKWSQFIPGHPQIIVTNLTPNIAAENQLWDSKPDGLTLLYNATSTIFDSAQSAAHFQSSKFSIIGAAVARDAVWMIRGNLPYNDIKDAVNAASSAPKITVPMSASLATLGGATQLGPLLAADDLNLPVTFEPTAQTGTEQNLIEVQRGDVNSFIAGSVWYQLPQRQPDWIPNNYVKPFAIVGGPKSTVAANAQAQWTGSNIYSLLTPDQQQVWDTMISPDTFVGKNLMGPPNMDPAVLDTLRTAWLSATADPTFLADYEKLLGEPATLAHMNGAELQTEWQQVEANFLKHKDELATLEQDLFQKYVH